jgi:hypothetical protein
MTPDRKLTPEEEGQEVTVEDTELMDLIPPVTPRRSYIDEEPDGYLESDRDFMENNREAVIWFLEHHETLRDVLYLLDRTGCAFLPCNGPDEEPVDQLTCSVCRAKHDLVHGRIEDES